MARRPRPFVMRGSAEPPERLTIVDPPDRRVVQVHPRALSAAELRVVTRPGALDPRLRPADRYLERWAATHGSGEVLPLAAVSSLTPRSPPAKILPLGDRESLLVDGAVRGSKPWARTFAILWYRSACTVQEIAVHLRIRRRQAVYDERNTVLAYYLGRFEEMGLPVTFWVEPS